MVIKPHRMYKIDAGDVLVKISGGGAGVGNPLEREPERVRDDVMNEVISLQAARETYGVVLDPKTLEVNLEQTALLRGQASA